MKRKVFNQFRATFEISESPHPPATTPKADCCLPAKPGFHNQTRFGTVDVVNKWNEKGDFLTVN